jgi:hypothetical protein
MVALFLASSAARLCAQCGEPPSDLCQQAREIPGTPGMHKVVMDVTTASGTGFYPSCGLNLGHTVWFKVVPTVDGTLTFSTCNPATTYDTVVHAFSRGEANCELMIYEDCNDDTVIGVCDNGCSFYGSVVTLDVTAGVTYRFEVGSYNDNSAGCRLCLGVTVTLCPRASCCRPGDVNGDGLVDLADLGILLANFGESCP